MKKYLTALFIFIAASTMVKAQSDSLVIKMEGGGYLALRLLDIKRIMFSQPAIVIGESGNQKGKNNMHNYPNPFSTSTTIEFDLEKSSSVKILIFNSYGNSVAKFEMPYCNVGKNKLKWNRRNEIGELLPVGVYYFELIEGDAFQSHKMIIVQ